MQLNVGNGYGRSAVPGFVIHKCWAQWYAATNSPNITEKSQVSPRNGRCPFPTLVNHKIQVLRPATGSCTKNPPVPGNRGTAYTEIVFICSHHPLRAKVSTHNITTPRATERLPQHYEQVSCRRCRQTKLPVCTAARPHVQRENQNRSTNSLSAATRRLSAGRGRSRRRRPASRPRPR